MFHYRLLGSKSSKGSGAISTGNEGKQHFSNTTRQTAFLDRTQLHNAKRVVIKMGSAVITRDDGMVRFWFFYLQQLFFFPDFSISRIFAFQKKIPVKFSVLIKT